MYDDCDSPVLRQFDIVEYDGGVATLDFLLPTPATFIEATEYELAREFDLEDVDAHIASIALRRWRARGDADVALIERLADADFAITYHAEEGGSVSVSASLWFATLDEADETLYALGAQGRPAGFSTSGPGWAETCTRFVVGFGAFSGLEA